MKRIVVAVIVAFSFIAVGLAVLMVFAINRGGNFNMTGSGDAKLVNTQQINLEGIDSIKIKYYYDDILFYSSDSEELIIKEYKNFTPDEDELAKITKSSNQLSITGKKMNMRWFHNINARVEVYLPAKYASKLTVSTSSGNISSDLVLKLSQFSASSTSGDVELNEVDAEEIKVGTSSGNITLQTAEGRRNISSTSGDIEVYNGSGDGDFDASSGNITIKNATGQLTVTSTSGDIDILDSNGDKEISASSGQITLKNSIGFIRAHASSGDIWISNSKGAGKLGTTSGNIEFELSEVTDNIDLNASSGDVTLKLPDNLGFMFSANASSGDIETSFDDQLSYNKRGNSASGSIGDAPDISVNITTSSGSISVKSK